MIDPIFPTPPATRAWHRRWRRLLAVGLLRVVVLGSLGFALVCAVAWLGGSQSGLRWICATLVEASAGRLQVAGAEGRLLGEWRAQSLRWSDATQTVALEQLLVNWSPAALLAGRLDFERIEAASVYLDFAPQSAPATLPDSLRLPLPLSIGQLRIGRLVLGAADGRAGQLLAEAIVARLASDGVDHRLEALQARLGQLALAAQVQLSGQAPFTLAAQATLSGAAHGQSFALDLNAGGRLDRLRIDGQATGDKAGAAGELAATFTPFAAQPLESLRLRFVGIDPALFVADAPRAQLDVSLALARESPVAPADAAAGDALAGHLRLDNRQSGSIDRQLLPLRSLASRVDWRGGTLDLADLVVELAGGGRLAGRGRLAEARLALELSAQRVDAQAVHGALLPTRLAGPLRATLGLQKQSVNVDWRDTHYALAASVSADGQAIEVARLHLASGGAALDVQGKLALTGARRFSAHGRLRDFDPARFLAASAAGLPHSLINAGLEARGALTPALELALNFTLADSRIGGQSLAGKGQIDWSGARLRKADVDLTAAGNRLRALGGFGRDGDALRVTLGAPRLGALGWSALSGDLDASIELAGSLARPEFSGEISAERLRLAPWIDLAGLSFKAQLASGASDVVAGRLRCSACALPVAGVPPLAIDVTLDGQRQNHSLRALVGLPAGRQLSLVVDGGVAAPAPRSTTRAPAPGWQGRLTELRLSAARSGATSAASAPLLELAAPAALQFGATTLSCGPATLAGRLGRLTIARLALEDGRWASVGNLQQFRPQDLLVEFPSLQAWREALGTVNAQPLVLAGDWDLAFGAAPAGRVALWRERGDLQLGAQALGLSAARLQATLGDGRLAADAVLRGSRLGEISATLSALLDDRQAPWQGRLQARVPDLSWLGVVLGEGWQVAGAAQGELRLAGSAERPELSGQWRGEQLALRALDQGMRLERGEALLELTPERLLLRKLRFESELQPLPRVLRLDPRLDAARLRATPGVLEASGELPLAAGAVGSTARLAVRLDRVGIVQRADQWVAVSGDGELRLAERLLEVGGTLRADAAFWSLAEVGRPSLSDDVVLRRASAPREGSRVARALKLDLAVALGRSAYFHGAGVDSRLAGDLRIRSDDAGLPRATGSIRTVDGRFDAYGQTLEIERGIVNFQGPIDNPGLNLLAVRKNLQVEAGVEVTGTAQRPQTRLVSTPTVPDAEKLSWLVLGRSPEQRGGDSALLLTAAQTILGGQDGGVLRQLQRGLGIDEFGVASGQIGGLGSVPTSRVASSSGFSGSTQTVNGQVVSVGKRLSANALLSYQQSLNTTESIVKLTVNLSRQFSVVASAGSDSALDNFWTRSFGK